MVKKLLFAATHPVQVWRFAQRQSYLAWAARRYTPQHRPGKRPGQILSTGFFDTTDWQQFPDRKAADAILKGNLVLYGLQPIKTTPIPDWHRDYLSDFRWTNTAFAPTITYSYPVGTDIKNPWEVSRAHHLVTLGFAYRQTGDEKYAEHFKATILNWIDENPLYYSVNWKVAMEVAIRAANWLLAYDLFRESPAITQDADFLSTFLGSLEEHGDFIFHNLEYYGVRSNHYYSDLIGLIWLGLLCPELKGAKRWLAYSQSELEREMLHQFYPDGLNFEASIAYHRLVLEMTLYTALLAQKHNVSFSSALTDRLEQACLAVQHYLTPNGEAPQFGDNDTGRFFILADYAQWNPLQQRYLLNLAALVFPHNKAFQVESPRELWWANLPPAQPTKPVDHIFTTGQIAIHSAKDWWLAVMAAPIGQDGNGGHNHDDAGSFELFYKDKPLIVDPGTGCYTANPKTRNAFRSASAHNAPIDPQKVHQPHSLLFVADDFTRATLDATTDSISAHLTATHYAFARQWKITEAGVAITDTRQNHQPGDTTQITLTVHPDVTVKQNKQSVSLGAVTLTSTGKITIQDGEWSQGYSTIVPTKQVVITSDQAEVVTKFEATA